MRNVDHIKRQALLPMRKVDHASTKTKPDLRKVDHIKRQALLTMSNVGYTMNKIMLTL